MKIYNYNPVTGEFISTSIADPDPIEDGAFLIPAHATMIVPPSTSTSEVAVFSESSVTWSIVPDFRGQTFYDQQNGDAVVIADIGAVPAHLGAAVPAQIVDARARSLARQQRNALIANSDWTMLPDAPLTSAQKIAWSSYRQALRDISSQTGFPAVIDWPVQP
jgi:hypothetical protein